METYEFRSLLVSGRLKQMKTVIAIGVFDGVHLGHKKIMETLSETAKREEAASLVISFLTNPKASSKGALDTIRLREKYVASFGVDFFALIDFSIDFSKISASGFVDLLLKITKPIAAVVGSDFRFGHPSAQASGKDIPRLFCEKGAECRVIEVDSVLGDNGEKISSTLLRQLVIQGELECFSRYSGQFYRVDLVPLPYRSCSGELIFSRASIHQLLPPLGSYDTRLCLSDGRCIECRAKIGREFLILSLPVHISVIGGEAWMDNEDLHIDSLFLEKRDDHEGTEERDRSEVR